MSDKPGSTHTVTDEEYKWEANGITSERLFVDRFLLAIIRANSHPKMDHESRLAHAKAALFGTSLSAGNDEIDDRRALVRMTREYMRDRGGEVVWSGKPWGWYPDEFEGARGVRELARDASIHTRGHSDGAIEDRLRKKFKKNKDFLLKTIINDTSIPSSLAAKNLRKLKRILETYDIAMDLEPDLGAEADD